MRDSRAFRAPLARNTWERVDAPKFSGDVHEVSSFKGANVSDGKNSYPVKSVLAFFFARTHTETTDDVNALSVKHTAHIHTGSIHIHLVPILKGGGRNAP